MLRATLVTNTKTHTLSPNKHHYRNCSKCLIYVKSVKKSIVYNIHQTTPFYWHCPHSMRIRLMKRYGVRPSVRLSVPFARCSNVRRVCCCGPGWSETSTDCCSSGVRQRALPRCQRTYVAEHRLVQLYLLLRVVFSPGRR